MSLKSYIYVDSLHLPELTMYLQTRESQLEHWFEPERGVFIAESIKVLERALAAGYVFWVITISIIGNTVYKTNKTQNYIVPISESSVEMQNIRLLTGPDGAHVYKFMTTDEYKSLRLYFKEYHNGQLMNRDDEYWETGFDGFGSPKEGELLIIPDFENYLIKVIISTDGT